MNNFYRALRLALSRRITFAFSLATALGVALLWGCNISALYPMVEIIFNTQSASEWVDGEIELCETRITKFEKEAVAVREAIGTAKEQEKNKLKDKLSELEVNLAAERKALHRFQSWRPFIHEYLPSEPFQTLLVVIAIVLVGTLIKCLLIMANTVFVARIAELTAFDLRIEFYKKTLDMDLAGFSEHLRGDLMNRFTANVDAVTRGIKVLVGRTVLEPMKMMVCLAGAAAICWRLLLLSLIVVPLAGWVISRLSKLLKKANRRAMEEMSQIYNSYSETLAGIKVIKAFTMERYELRCFHSTAKQYFRKAMKIARYNSFIKPLNEFFGLGIICSAFLIGGYLSLNQATHLFGFRISERPLMLGELMLFYGLLASMSDPAKKLADVYNRLQQAAAASDRVYEVLDRPLTVSEAANPKPLARHQQHIRFTDVSFCYGEGRSVLEKINLQIDFGETIAIVGPNGCGKSTLTNLIPRFFDATEGTVTIDGVDLREACLSDIRSQMGLVTQETLLFDDTVANNIRYGSLQASEADIIGAAKQAHADEFIKKKLSEGYETTVGPGGNRLSGGQRQRIAIARAILRDPSILILDEATSQIDLKSEELIHRVLQEFIVDRTTIIITHRLSTLALADRIVVMDHGQIVDIGTHQQLLARCEYYRRLHQFGLRESA